MVSEMQKKNPSDSLIRRNMDITFALRREEVVKHEPDISQMVQQWPALFTESQVCDSVFVCECVSVVYLTGQKYLLVLKVTLPEYQN